jgi:hypothetical protein
MRKIGENTLVFPHRGSPPVVPDGFVRSDNDPYILVRRVECVNLGTTTIQKQCCGTVNVMYCNRFNRVTSRDKCTECLREIQLTFDW